MDKTLISHSEEETEAIGAALGQAAQPGQVIALTGDLGAGKTCLTRGLARGLGIDGPVTSPTFILVAEYDSDRGFPLCHADAYRFNDPVPEAIDIGLDELMDSRGLCVIEWAERIAGLLPADHLRIAIDAPDPATRRLHLQATGPRSAELIVNSQFAR